jgi:hypothetical protein
VQHVDEAGIVDNQFPQPYYDKYFPLFSQAVRTQPRRAENSAYGFFVFARVLVRPSHDGPASVSDLAAETASAMHE